MPGHAETATTALYLNEAGPAPVLPAFADDAQTGIAIIGGGLTGLSTALHLAEAGHAVTVLEAESPGWGASGRNGGHLNPGLKFDPSWFIETFGENRGRALIAFGWSTVDETVALIERLGLDCALRRCGTLRAATSAAEAETVRKTFDDMRAHDMPVEWLDAPRLAQETGHGLYHGGLLDRRGAEVNPLRYTRALAQAAAGLGVRIHGQSRVTGMARAGEGWALTANGATLRADRVLVACNGYADGLVPGLKQASVPVLSSVLASNPLTGALAEKVFPARRVLYEAGLVTVYYRVDADGHLVIGGRGPMRHSASAAEMQGVARRALELWPELKGHGWKHAWNGRVAMTPDHLPHVHAPQPGLMIAYGYNGRGVALATAMGKHLAGVLGGRVAAEEFILPPTEMRRIPFHPFWPIGVQATIAYGRMRARLAR